MESSRKVAKQFRFFRVYEDGRFELLFPQKNRVPPSDDPTTGVRSKDIAISVEPPVSVRIFIPKLTNPNHKFTLLFYIHGGGFCKLSAFHRTYHNFCSTVSAQANALVVSVEYGLFPDRPIPACYDDSWAALNWAASHMSGNGPDPWLNDHADFSKVFIAGDSSGANIAHNLAFRVGSLGLRGAKVIGLILLHPFFGGSKDDGMWLYMCPINEGPQDPRLNPPAEDLARLGCDRVLIFLAKRDYLYPAGRNYYEKLKESGWKGRVELVQNIGEDHGFQWGNPKSEKAMELVNKFSSFINHNNGSSIISKY